MLSVFSREGWRHASIRPIDAALSKPELGHLPLQQNTYLKSTHLAKPNFQYEKRQKELEKKRKKEEKLKRKAEKGNAADDGTEASDADTDESDTDTDATGPASN